MKPHPKSAQARVLLTSVFGPQAQEDEFGSRSIWERRLAAGRTYEPPTPLEHSNRAEMQA